MKIFKEFGSERFPEIPYTLSYIGEQNESYSLVRPGTQPAVRTYILYQVTETPVSKLKPLCYNSRGFEFA